MLKLSKRAWRWLRTVALIAIIAGIGFPAIKLPIDAFGASSEVFDRQVGWANILAYSLAAVGFLMLLAEKGSTLISVEYDLAQLAGKLAAKSQRRGARSLAQLLSTDGLDSRAAPFQLVLNEHGRRSSKSRTIGREELGNFFTNHAKGRMAILGPPGSGKSVLALQLADQLIAGASGNGRVPIVLSLASWDPGDIDLENWLIKEISLEFSLKEKMVKSLVYDGRIIPILDGLDEMGPSGETMRSIRAVERINEYTATTSQCQIVVTSRSDRLYDRLVGRLRGMKVVNIALLDGRQIERHIRVHCSNSQRFDEWELVFQALRSRKSTDVQGVLGTPWRLTAAVVYFLGGGHPEVLLQARSDGKREENDEYVKRVRDALVGSFVYSRVAAHSKSRDIPRRISVLLVIVNRLNSMTASNEVTSEVILYDWWKNIGEKKVRVLHLFFAFVLLHLPSLTLGLFDDRVEEGGLTGLWLLSALSANYITIMLCTMLYVTRDREPSRLSVELLRVPRIAMLTAVFAVAVAAISTVIALLSDSLMAVLYGLIAILMIALNAGSSLSPPGVDEVLSPIRVIKNDLNVAVLGSLLLGAYGILYYLPLYGVSVAIWFGGMCALGRFCCSAFVRYFCAATYGSLRFGLPWAFAKFMDWGRAAGLLRISGAGYQFRHREIKEYLDAVIVGSAPYPGV